MSTPCLESIFQRFQGCFWGALPGMVGLNVNPMFGGYFSEIPGVFLGCSTRHDRVKCQPHVWGVFFREFQGCFWGALPGMIGLNVNLMFGGYFSCQNEHLFTEVVKVFCMTAISAKQV